MIQEIFYVLVFAPHHYEEHEDSIVMVKPLSKMVFTNSESADAFAEEKAMQLPGAMVHILKTTRVKQALAPTVVNKAFNGEGELVNV